MNRGPVVALALALASCRAVTPPRRFEVEIRDLAFVPARLEVAVGDTVVWIDHDIVPHTATADRPGGWEVGPVLGGSSGLLVVTEAGEIAYHCRFHPVMHGVLSVHPQR